jgi:hypothetical protein
MHQHVKQLMIDNLPSAVLQASSINQPINLVIFDVHVLIRNIYGFVGSVCDSKINLKMKLFSSQRQQIGGCTYRAPGDATFHGNRPFLLSKESKQEQ